VDYIENNIDSELNLNTLSEIAGFSPFHFHRIFSALSGETLNNYIRRVRAEKAARYLVQYPEMNISEISDICGYSSMPVFCRTFKDIFNVSAQEFRDSRHKKLSKKSQSNSNISQEKDISTSDICIIEPNDEKIEFMKTNVEVKHMPELDVLYVRHIGAFEKIGEAYGKLMMWAGPRGLLQNPELKTVTVYHDDPSITEMENVRQSACITINQDVKPEGEIGKMKIPAGQFAVGRFEIGVEEFTEAWDTMCQWFSQSGYQPGEGYYYELYHNNHEEHPEKKFILDICIPVKSL